MRLEDERKEFEAWIRRDGGTDGDLVRNGEGYLRSVTDQDWRTWKAARAAPKPLANRITDDQILSLAHQYHYERLDISGYEFSARTLIDFVRATIVAEEDANE